MHEITLTKAERKDAAALHEMQVRAFMPLLEKYRDFGTNPANESVERIVDRIGQPFTDYYLILCSGTAVGGIRIVRKDDRVYRVSPVFVVPEHQGKGIAQMVFSLIEHFYADARLWELETILQERGNCRLYEKLGYRQTGKTQVVNDKMTLVFYEKHVG